MTSIPGEKVAGTKYVSIIGYYLGAAVNVDLGNNLSIQPELLYSAQGGSLTGNTTETEKNGINVKLNYITVPIMLKYHVWEGLSLEAGPQLGFLVSKSVEVFTPKVTLNLSKELSAKTFDLSLAFGAGYDLPRNFFLQARYGFGLTSIQETKSEGTSIYDQDIKPKNSVFQLGVGVYF